MISIKSKRGSDFSESIFPADSNDLNRKTDEEKSEHISEKSNE
jgi:hypothetical protein